MLTSEKLGLSTSTLQFQWWKRRTRPPFWVLWVWGRMCNNSSSKMRDLSLLLTPLLTDHTPCDYLSSGVLQHSDSPITPANARALFFDLASHQVQREARAQEEQKTNYQRNYYYYFFFFAALNYCIARTTRKWHKSPQVQTFEKYHCHHWE